MFKRRHVLLVVLSAAMVHSLPLEAAAATQVDPPVNITIRTVRNTRISGRLLSYDAEGFEYKNVIDLTRKLKWSEVNPQTDYLIHQKVMAKQDAKAWFRLGHRLLKREGGDKVGKEALDKAVRLDPKLREPAETVKKNPAAEIDLSPPPPPTPGNETNGRDSTGSDPDAPPIPVFKGNARPWKMLDATRTKGVVNKLKATADTHARKLGLKLQVTESNYFLIYSDLPLTQFSKYGAMLDRVDRTLSSIFQLKRDAHVWYGKALVFIFSKRENYEAFESKIYYTKVSKNNVSLHRQGDGSVIIATHRKADGPMFEDQLVKVAGEGYVYRYLSNLRLAAWIEKGLVGHIATKVIPRGPTFIDTNKQAIAKLIRDKNNKLGGDFFTARTLSPSRESTAIGLVTHMIQRDEKNFAGFVNALKAGFTWQVSLEQFYENPEADLLKQWGNALGVGAVTR